jgi:hypothetical protein
MRHRKVEVYPVMPNSFKDNKALLASGGFLVEFARLITRDDPV